MGWRNINETVTGTGRKTKMIEKIKRFIMKIFHIRDYRELTIYLLAENTQLRRELEDIKFMNNLELMKICEEEGIDFDDLEDIGV